MRDLTLISIPETSFIGISRSLEVGVKAGKDWLTVIRWISIHDSSPKIRIYFQGFLKRFSIEPTEGFLEQESRSFNSSLARVFFQILKLQTRGTQNLSRLLCRFSKLAERIDMLKRREKSVAFVPKFQAGVSLIISLFFIFVLPLVSADHFQSFIGLGRWDLFAGGFGVLILGFMALLSMTKRVRRHLEPYLQLVFLLQYLSIFIESGQDLIGAWYKAIEISDLSPDLKSKIKKKDLTVESMDGFLESLSHRMSKPWDEILVGILWAKTSGIGLSQYLQSASDQQSEMLITLWDEEIRKLSITTLVPLGFLIFPSILFLLLGPQLIQLVNL